MGTLQDQLPRKSFGVTEKDLEDLIKTVKKVAARENVDFDQALKAAEILERKRTNDLAIANGNIHDEQMSGIGSILDTLNEKLGCLFEAIENN